MPEIKIRVANASDAEKLMRIYEPYVHETAITFDYTLPSVEEFTERIEKTKEKYPYIVAEKNGDIVGYAYASRFKDRVAYDMAVETTVYVEKNGRGHGIGRALYNALEKLLKAQNVLNMNACIAFLDAPDEYLTDASYKFHEKMGFSLAGRFHKCGYKFGRWYDMVWMEKFIGEHTENPKQIIAFNEIKSISK